jgi:hypothetical protein
MYNRTDSLHSLLTANSSLDESSLLNNFSPNGVEDVEEDLRPFDGDLSVEVCAYERAMYGV